MSNQFIDWLTELIQRFTGATPRFFKVLGVVGAVAAFIGFLPDLLSFLNITLPITFFPWTERILKIAGITMAVVAKLSVQSKTVAVTETGTLLKATNEKKLPFTAKNEEKANALKPLPVVTEEVLPTLPKKEA